MSLKWDGNVPSAQIFLIDPAETKCTPDGQFIIAIPLLALTWKVVAAAAVAAFVGYELEHQFG
ncbi:MAG: hypothetical protein JSR57_11450, partial [Verrucomicrobia bacterium]|nr:hypothetical protein [Verrucomicrobiota bacterium]